ISVGMAAAVLITLWVLNERSYDMFHHKKDRLYKVMNRATYNGKTNAWDYTPKVMGPVLKAEFSEIANVTREAVENPLLLTVGEKKTTVPGAFVDSVFLDMFDFPLLAGNKKNVLVRPTDIVITESLGKKLFGDENPMGKSIQVESEDILTVSGVLADLPDNSTFSKFEYFLPWTYL